MGSCLRRPTFTIRLVSDGTVTTHAIDSTTTATQVLQRQRATDPRAASLTFSDCPLPPGEPLVQAGIMDDAELHVVHAERRVVPAPTPRAMPIRWRSPQPAGRAPPHLVSRLSIIRPSYYQRRAPGF
jgi:hypothetical protein